MRITGPLLATALMVSACSSSPPALNLQSLASQQNAIRVLDTPYGQISDIVGRNSATQVSPNEALGSLAIPADYCAGIIETSVQSAPNNNLIYTSHCRFNSANHAYLIDLNGPIPKILQDGRGNGLADRTLIDSNGISTVVRGGNCGWISTLTPGTFTVTSRGHSWDPALEPDTTNDHGCVSGIAPIGDQGDLLAVVGWSTDRYDDYGLSKVTVVRIDHDKGTAIAMTDLEDGVTCLVASPSGDRYAVASKGETFVGRTGEKAKRVGITSSDFIVGLSWGQSGLVVTSGSPLKTGNYVTRLASDDLLQVE